MRGTTIRGAEEYGVCLHDGGGFTDCRDNVITGCGERAMLIDAEYVRTIGTGNRFSGNSVWEDGRDGIEVANDNEIVNSGTWLNHGVPYMILDDITIAQEEDAVPTITIAPGTRLELDGTGIYVGDGISPGGLVADGASERITFSCETTQSPWSGSWHGIVFTNSALPGQSLLRNCLIEGGGRDGGNIVCEDSAAPAITGNEISYSSAYGILLRRSLLEPDTLRARNSFHDNALGDIGTEPSGSSQPSHARHQVARGSRVHPRRLAHQEER